MSQHHLSTPLTQGAIVSTRIYWTAPGERGSWPDIIDIVSIRIFDITMGEGESW